MARDPITVLMVNEYPDYIDAQFWVAELERRLPSAIFRIWPDCGNKSNINLVLIDKGAPPDFFKEMSHLRAVVYLGAGVDGLDLSSFPQGVHLIRLATPEQTSEIVQYIVLRVLCHQRHVADYTKQQSQRHWCPIPPRKTSQTRIAILGAGRIGGWVAMVLADFGFQTAVWSRHEKTIKGIDTYFGPEQLGGVLADRDYVVCALPLTSETRGILNSRTFAMMKRGAYLVNVGRGAHVNVTELIHALNNGQLSGACLDVFDQEPLVASSPLWSHARVTVTPHVASFWVDSGIDQVAEVCSKIMRAEIPANVVDIQQGY